MESDWLLLLPVLLQGALMLVDEFFYHHRRGLPRWEVIGHPIDTCSVILPLMIVFVVPPASFFRLLFLLMAKVSCLCVIKDEWVHQDRCDKNEMFLHALLFICHPLVFIAWYVMWDLPFLNLSGYRVPTDDLYLGQLIILFVFFVYQIIYWGFYRASKHQQSNLSRSR